MTKEFRVTMRVKNNRLIKAREELGLSMKEAADLIAIPYSSLCAYETMFRSPIGTTGAWRRQALKVAAYYGQPPEHFWPAAVLAIQKTKLEAEVSAPDLLRLASPNAIARLPSDDAHPDEAILAEEESDQLETAMSKLTPREQDTLRRRFVQEETREAIADDSGISRERVRQLEEHALAKLRVQYERGDMRRFTGERGGLESTRVVRALRRAVRVPDGHQVVECTEKEPEAGRAFLPGVERWVRYRFVATSDQ